jgi:hypothetical protein
MWRRPTGWDVVGLLVTVALLAGFVLGAWLLVGLSSIWSILAGGLCAYLASRLVLRRLPHDRPR